MGQSLVGVNISLPFVHNLAGLPVLIHSTALTSPLCRKGVPSMFRIQNRQQSKRLGINPTSSRFNETHDYWTNQSSERI